MNNLELEAFHTSPDVINGRVSRRDEFEDAVDAGTYLHLLVTAAEITLDQHVRTVLSGQQPETIERIIRRDVLNSSTIPQLARRGIVAAGLPQTIFLLEHVPKDVREQTTVLYRNNQPSILMPKLPAYSIKRMQENRQMAVVQMNPGEPTKLRHPREDWQILARRMHESVYYPGIHAQHPYTTPHPR